MNKLAKKEEIYKTIKDNIIQGRYFPGERLREKDLANEFGINRSHIKEAFIRLNEERLLEIIPNQGATVKRLSLEEIENSYGVIAQLEAYAAQLALAFINNKNLEGFEKINENLRMYMAEKEYTYYIRENLNFHLFLANLSQNSILTDIITNLRNRNLAYSYHILYFSDYGEEYLVQHNKIIEACRSKIPEQISECIKKHILSVKDNILSDFKKKNLHLSTAQEKKVSLIK